jgi:hypothetical protein
LLCEEENLAAELNLKLSKVQRKLWINPFKFQQPEDLTQFNTKMILSYLKPKTLLLLPPHVHTWKIFADRQLSREKRRKLLLMSKIK